MSKVKAARERVRDLPDEELVQALDRTREELFRLRLGNYTNQVENTISLRIKQRELARILTIQRARELGLETQMSSGRPRPQVEPDAGADEADEDADEAPKTVAERARAIVTKEKAAAKAAAAKPKAKAKPAAKPAAKATKAKPGAKTSKKSGKE